MRLIGRYSFVFVGDIQPHDISRRPKEGIWSISRNVIALVQLSFIAIVVISIEEWTNREKEPVIL